MAQRTTKMEVQGKGGENGGIVLETESGLVIYIPRPIHNLANATLFRPAIHVSTQVRRYSGTPWSPTRILPCPRNAGRATLC